MNDVDSIAVLAWVRGHALGVGRCMGALCTWRKNVGQSRSHRCQDPDQNKADHHGAPVLQWGVVVVVVVVVVVEEEEDYCIK